MIPGVFVTTCSRRRRIDQTRKDIDRRFLDGSSKMEVPKLFSKLTSWVVIKSLPADDNWERLLYTLIHPSFQQDDSQHCIHRISGDACIHFCFPHRSIKANNYQFNGRTSSAAGAHGSNIHQSRPFRQFGRRSPNFRSRALVQAQSRLRIPASQGVRFPSFHEHQSGVANELQAEPCPGDSSGSTIAEETNVAKPAQSTGSKNAQTKRRTNSRVQKAGCLIELSG